jgi:hypothetical protein
MQSNNNTAEKKTGAALVKEREREREGERWIETERKRERYAEQERKERE